MLLWSFLNRGGGVVGDNNMYTLLVVVFVSLFFLSSCFMFGWPAVCVVCAIRGVCPFTSVLTGVLTTVVLGFLLPIAFVVSGS